MVDAVASLYDCVFLCLHFIAVLGYILYVFYICCLCVINGWTDGLLPDRRTVAFKVMTVFLMLLFFLVNKGLCVFYTVKCVIFSSERTPKFGILVVGLRPEPLGSL